MKPLYIINKKNNWHCQRQKTSRILLASAFLTRTARYKLDLFFCFSYTDDKFICYVLLMLLTFHNFTVNINIYQNLPIQCPLLKQRIAKSAFCVIHSIFSSFRPNRGASSGEYLHDSVFIFSQNLQLFPVHHVVLPNLVSFSL